MESLVEAIKPALNAGSFSIIDHSRKLIALHPGDINLRIQDCARIADKIIFRWVESAKKEYQKDIPSDELRLQFIESLFSFTTFALLGWTCLEGYRSLCREIAHVININTPMFNVKVAPSAGIMADIRTFRNKTVAHLAKFEGKATDTMASRDAYFNWNIGWQKSDFTSMQLNTVDIALTTSNCIKETSTQIKLPPLCDLQVKVSNEYHRASKEIAMVFLQLGQKLPQIVNSLEYSFSRI